MPVYLELVTLIGWNVPNYQGVFLQGYGGQTSYYYGAVDHLSAGLGELQSISTLKSLPYPFSSQKGVRCGWT